MENQQQHQWIKKVSGNNNPLFFILGPCAIESEDHCLAMAEKLKELSLKKNFNFVFKVAFDKANRQSVSSYRGIGMTKGLEIIKKVRDKFDVPVITDVHESWQVNEVADVVDVIQIPAYLCRQTDLLLAAGKTGKPIHLKKGQFYRAEKADLMAKKVESTGNKHVWLCERGYTFGYEDLIVDFKNFQIMKQFGYPVIFDATHAVQKPGQLGPTSGGARQFVASLTASAVVQGIAGIFMEVHEEPEKALSDGSNMIRLSQLPALLDYLIELDEWAKEKPVPEVN